MRSIVAISLVATFLAAIPAQAARPGKMVVLGVDGLDPVLLQQFITEGVLPNFARLIDAGDLAPLQTSAAAQSPVAWSTFITGMDPGGHGIYDFVHRDPDTMLPYLSMSRAVAAEHQLTFGDWVLPLSSGKVELLRKGRAFWEILGEKGIPTTVFRMPVNFPPVEAPRSRQLSGMGTPDIQGTSGTFSYFAEVLPENAEDFTGGKAYRVQVRDQKIEATLEGPKNPFRRAGDNGRRPACTSPFSIYLDRESRAARFEVGEQVFILQEKEWSGWVHVTFNAAPLFGSFNAVGRFYLKQVAPRFELYVSPLQIDPKNPVMPISSPPGWSAELCDCLDYFYTQELPHDTKAFTHGVFSGREFWDQLVFVNDEARLLYRNLLRDHKEGFLFFYFGSVDQGSHMLWHYRDREHPNFTVDEFLAGGIRRIYEKMDAVLGHTLESIDDDTTLVVMSDHGFAPFYRGVNLNSWLLEKGYAALRNPEHQGESDLFQNVDWNRTKAYAMGLNGLYVNLRGRERQGIVTPGREYETLLKDLERDLLEMKDPSTGLSVVTRLTRPLRDFNGPYRDDGPDLIVGYGWGYRSSWDSPLGSFPKEIIVDNLDAWSADHCIDSRLVPGVLIANRPITLEKPSLHDLTVSVLDEYGIAAQPGMIGEDCIGDRPAAGSVPPE